jgi:hypothetical protein
MTIDSVEPPSCKPEKPKLVEVEIECNFCGRTFKTKMQIDRRCWAGCPHCRKWSLDI